MTLIDLTFLILQLNHLVDHDLHRPITLDDARDHIRKGDVFEWLDQKFMADIDLSIYRGQPSRNEISAEWANILGGYEGSENRKWGVAKNGICLLLAWTNEIVQQQTAYRIN